MRIGVTELLLILVIVLLLFGTKKLKTLGSDLGDVVRGFRGALRDGEKSAGAPPTAGNTIDNDSGGGKPSA